MAVNITNKKISDYSRRNLLDWVNQTLKTELTKVNDLCTGAAYCQFMDMLFPGSVILKKVKFRTNLKHEFIQNFQLLEGSFKKLNVDKKIPIDALIKGRFEDNFDFLKWFKHFFDTNYEGRSYDALNARDGGVIANAAEPIKKRKLSLSYPLRKLRATKAKKSAATALKSNSGHDVSMKSIQLQQQISVLSTQLMDIRLDMEVLQKERDLYLSKLRVIEIILQQDGKKKHPLTEKIQGILNAATMRLTMDHREREMRKNSN